MALGNLKNLSLESMVSLTEGWLDPARLRPELEALPSGKACVDRLEDAKKRLIVAQRMDLNLARELTAVHGQLAATDWIHDRKVRGVWLALSAYAELVDDERMRSRLAEARDRLIPDGLRVTQRSYGEEANSANVAETKLNSSTTELLKQTPAPLGRTLWDEVQAWLDAARALQTLEDERKRLIASGASKTEEAAEQEIFDARAHWIKVVRHLETSLDLDGAPETLIHKILGPVEDASLSAATTTPPVVDAGGSARPESDLSDTDPGVAPPEE